LLLNSDIALPILQVKIELTRFFLFAPILLVLIHVGLVSQLALLARKTLEFAASIRMLETTEQRTHPLRLELDNFFFVQAIAGAVRQANARGAGYILGYAVPGLGAAHESSLFGLFQRNLNVTDLDLVVDKDVTPGEPSINLRGRDLRFARLDRTDLHQADMT